MSKSVSGERIQVAGGQPSETPVAQPRLLFLLDELIQTQSHPLHRLLHLIIDAEVDEAVRQVRPHQKFRRHVAHYLDIPLLHRLHRLDPAMDEPISHRVCQGHVPVIACRDLGKTPLHIHEVMPHRVGNRRRAVPSRIILMRSPVRAGRLSPSCVAHHAPPRGIACRVTSGYPEFLRRCNKARMRRPSRPRRLKRLMLRRVEPPWSPCTTRVVIFATGQWEGALSTEQRH